ETADFTKQAATPSDWFSLFKHLKEPLLKALLLCTFLNVGYPILTLWMPFYLTCFLKVPFSVASLTNTLTLRSMVPFCLGSVYLSQFIGYKKLFIGSLIANFLLIIPIFKGF